MPPPAAPPSASRSRPALRRDGRGTTVSKRVRFLRRALPVAIAVLLALLLGWILTRAILTHLSNRSGAVSEIRMIKPKFFGRDSRNRPFTINATTAVRDARDQNQVNLERPVFILQTGAPKPTTLTSLTGLYREDTRNLLLTGQVVYDDANGSHYVTERALIDTVKSNATGDTPISGGGPLGQISASSYAMYDGGARMVFTGAVKTRIIQSSGHH